MNTGKTLSLAVLVALAVGTAQATAQTLSNRHQLSGCTAQSEPIIIPYADYRSVRLGLPADLDGRVRIHELHGYDEETRLRLRRNGLSLATRGGGAILSLSEDLGCSAH